MYFIISFGENDFLDYRYNSKSNIVVMCHCLFSAKRWKTRIGVYRAAMHLPKTFIDWVIIYKVVLDENLMPKVLCRWNLDSFFSLEIAGV